MMEKIVLAGLLAAMVASSATLSTLAQSTAPGASAAGAEAPMPFGGSVAGNVRLVTTDPQNAQVELAVHTTVVGG